MYYSPQVFPIILTVAQFRSASSFIMANNLFSGMTTKNDNAPLLVFYALTRERETDQNIDL